MTIQLLYWDSDAFLGWLQAEKGKVELCQGTLERATAGEVLIITSSLTLAEVLWLRNSPRIPEEKADVLRKFFRRSYIRVKNVTRATSEMAQDVVWHHSIKPKDAIHVATALEHNVPVLETFDEELLKRTGSVGSPGLVIRRPIAAAQSRMAV